MADKKEAKEDWKLVQLPTQVQTMFQDGNNEPVNHDQLLLVLANELREIKKHLL